MGWKALDPFQQRAVQSLDDLLFPTRSYKAQWLFEPTNGILGVMRVRQVLSTAMTVCIHQGPQDKRRYLTEADPVHKGRDECGLFDRLLKGKVWIIVFPVFIIDFHWQVEVKAEAIVSSRSASSLEK